MISILSVIFLTHLFCSFIHLKLGFVSLFFLDILSAPFPYFFQLLDVKTTKMTTLADALFNPYNCTAIYLLKYKCNLGKTCAQRPSRKYSTPDNFEVKWVFTHQNKIM